MIYSSLLERALRLAAAAHVGQQRKGTSIPYLTHLAGTALLLARAGLTDETLLAAALLHDALEDTELTRDEIERDLGAEVAQIVADASEIKRDDQGRRRPWHARKTEHLARLEGRPWPSRAVVLADKLHNLGTLLDDFAAGDGCWERFNAAPAEIVRYYESAFELAGEDTSLEPLAAEGRRRLESLRRYLPADGSASSRSN